MDLELRNWLAGLNPTGIWGDGAFWSSKSGWIDLFVYPDQLLEIYYIHYNTPFNTVTRVDGQISDLKNYFFNKTLKQMILSLQDEGVDKPAVRCYTWP